MKIDKKDKIILEVLKEDSSLSSKAIARKTLIPITTVHNRITKLKQEGVIKRYTLELDEKKLGRNIFAHILIKVDNKELKEKGLTQEKLATKIKKERGVDQISIVAGGSDIILKVGVKDIDELNEFVVNKLKDYDGVESTSTMVILKDI